MQSMPYIQDSFSFFCLWTTKGGRGCLCPPPPPPRTPLSGLSWLSFIPHSYLFFPFFLPPSRFVRSDFFLSFSFLFSANGQFFFFFFFVFLFFVCLLLLFFPLSSENVRKAVVEQLGEDKVVCPKCTWLPYGTFYFLHYTFFFNYYCFCLFRFYIFL